MDVAKLFLSRADLLPNTPDRNGQTALWIACSWNNHLAVVKWWIASGHPLDLKVVGKWGDEIFTPLEIARRYNCMEIVSLLERYRQNPMATRREVCWELGVVTQGASLFALVVLCTDDYLKPIETNLGGPRKPLAKFFQIAKRLPLEIQMVLCCRTVGSMRNIIRSRDVEIALRTIL